jgi:hypothetical protein
LPSARYKALGKEFFADAFFAGGSLPSAALGKGFTKGIIAFAECIAPESSSDGGQRGDMGVVAGGWSWCSV